MSDDFINNLHISKYIGANESLPISGIPVGTIYAKGPTYAEDDTNNDNPIYRLWVYAWKGDTLAWQDNGEFTSIAAGIVQETGDNENAVMSQKATSKAVHDILYDVSANNDGAVFDSLQALLSSSNLSTLIPISVQHGGMSIRFIQGSEQSSDNKYVQYRLTKQDWSVIPVDWESTDDIHNRVDISELEIVSPYETLSGYRITYNSGPSDAHVVSFSSGTIIKYNVEPGKVYTFNIYEVGLTWAVVWWLNNNDEFIGLDYVGSGDVDNWINKPIIAPLNAVKVWFNIQTINIERHKLNLVGDVILSDSLKKQVEQNTSNVGINTSDIAELQQKLTDTELTLLTPFETLTGYRIAANDPLGTNPQVVSFSAMSVRKYNVQSSRAYTFSSYIPESYSNYVLFWFDSGGNHLRTNYQGTDGEIDEWTDQSVVAPENASQMWMNVINNYDDKYNFKSVTTSLIDVEELKEQVEQNTANIGQIKVSKMMKVVINDLEGAVETTPFYIRSRYNESKDIIITHRVNSNGCVTFRDTYIGANILTDEQLMQSSYLVSAHQDSTSPLYGVSQYWHLFAQHGYVIPYINNPGLTNSDIGAEWKDQSERHYKIGNVSNDRVWLLPVIYTQDGHSVRDWKTPNSPAITALQHVSGGSYTTDISVSGYGNTQLFPIMQKTHRIWRVDNKEVTEAGVYYGDGLSVSESQIGYDPATVQTWFDSNGKVDLTGALPMAEFTYSFNYNGAQCCVNTTINILRSIDCTIYGGTQQQFFFDKGDYKAMFMIPKAKSRNDVDFEKPFNSPLSSSTGYVFYRDAASLNDVDDIIDRQIGFLKNPNTNDYLVGMASGLSLVSGDTVKVKRNQNCMMGNTNVHYLVLNFSPANTNKFYVAAFNGSHYEDNDYYLPAGFFKEVNYYVSYFDPAENEGQVYWYKDGNDYVIYAHCQSVQSALAIKVPDFMEGLKMTIIEKTADTELLTDTIQNGKFFVNYNTEYANYIVLKAK